MCSRCEWQHHRNARGAQGDTRDRHWQDAKPRSRVISLPSNVGQGQSAAEADVFQQPNDVKTSLGDYDVHGALMTSCEHRTQAPPISTVAEKSREWKIIERSTGIVFDSLDDSLGSIDSLKRTKMTSALRREAGKQLSREQLKGLTTLGGLLQEVKQTTEEPLRLPSEREMEGGLGYRAWGLMWTSRCSWVLLRKKPVSEEMLRIAVIGLMERHVALRAELGDPYSFFGAVQKAFSRFEVWRRHAPPSDNGVLQRANSLLSRATAWSFQHAWPRVRVGACPRDSTVPLQVLSPSETMEEAEWRVWPRGQAFRPPFQVILAPFGKTADEGAFIYLAVTHMLSDGYSLIPLLDDLAHLVAMQETAAVAPMSPLPQLPHMLSRLEGRLLQTILNSSQGITRDPVGMGRRWHDPVCTFATLPEGVVSSVRLAAKRLSIPDDIAMLTILGVTLSWLAGRKLEPLAMIVPQRDGTGENDMVGLFADIRHLNVCTEGLSLAGVALRMHHTVEQRQWFEPGLATQCDVTLVNFEWTDFEERHGFVQKVSLTENNESSFYPLRVALDQPDRTSWRMRVMFDRELYDEAARELFFTHFETSLQCFLHDPLRMVWPEDTHADQPETVSS